MKPKRTADLSLFLTVTGLLLAAAFSTLTKRAFSQSLVQDTAILRFEDYHVPVYSGKTHTINWKSVPQASRYDKKIKTAVTKGVNFAGHYHIVEWSCGPHKTCWVIVDLKTGWIYEENPTECGLDFRSDSRMLEGKDCMPGQIHAGGTIGTFEWRENKLYQIRLGAR